METKTDISIWDLLSLVGLWAAFFMALSGLLVSVFGFFKANEVISTWTLTEARLIRTETAEQRGRRSGTTFGISQVYEFNIGDSVYLGIATSFFKINLKMFLESTVKEDVVNQTYPIRYNPMNPQEVSRMVDWSWGSLREFNFMIVEFFISSFICLYFRNNYRDIMAKVRSSTKNLAERQRAS